MGYVGSEGSWRSRSLPQIFGVPVNNTQYKYNKMMRFINVLFGDEIHPNKIPAARVLFISSLLSRGLVRELHGKSRAGRHKSGKL